MVTVRVLFCVFCAGLGYWGWGFNGGVVGHEEQEITSLPRNEGTGEERRRQGADAVIRAAQKEIGVQEIGQNTGTRVDQYGAYVGIKGLPWCAAFVSWVFREAGYAAPRTAWCPSLFPAKRKVKAAGRGMVMGLYYVSLGRVGHCGIVCSLRGDWVVTVEGNTGFTGEREGQGVWRKTRHKRTIHCYADWL